MVVDEFFVRRAVEQADLNALRLALLQATGDQALAKMKLQRTPVRGGATTAITLAKEHHEEVTAKAVEFLLALETEGGFTPPPPPSESETRAMMEMLTGEPLSDRMFVYGKNFLAFEDFPIAAEWTNGRPELPEHFWVAIIGAGFSGIAMALQLQRLGIPYKIYERRHELGGTWSINTYPDARVDTSSFTYQFGFEKNYPWTEYFARQSEVRTYLEHLAHKYGIYEHIVFNSDLEVAEFDEKAAQWQLTIHINRVREVVHPRVVVSGTGLFSTPRALDTEGVEDFQGQIVHTTEWTEENDVRGKRVAIIGNGSTGVQCLQRIASEASQVYVCQRTPQWISPRENYGVPITPETRWLFDTMPNYWNWYCYSMIAMGLGTQDLQEQDPEYQKKAPGTINERNEKFRLSLTEYIRDQVQDDPDLMSKLVPDYPPMARRLIVDNKWYRTLLEDHVELVTDPIEQVMPTGFVTADGTEREVDVIVAAIGFAVTKYLWPARYFGLGGVKLEDAWDHGEGPMAYLGMTVPDFPNLFVMYGPNSQPRSGSIPSWIEVWSRYVAQSVVTMIEGGHSRIVVRRDVFDRYNADLDQAARKLVWDEAGSKGKNYYVNPSGRQQVNAPWRVEDFYDRLKAPNPDEFIFG